MRRLDADEAGLLQLRERERRVDRRSAPRRGGRRRCAARGAGLGEARRIGTEARGGFGRRLRSQHERAVERRHSRAEQRVRAGESASRPSAGGGESAEASAASTSAPSRSRRSSEGSVMRASTPARKGGAPAASTSMRPPLRGSSTGVRPVRGFEERHAECVDVRRGNGVSLVLPRAACSRVFDDGARVEHAPRSSQNGRPRSRAGRCRRLPHLFFSSPV